MISNLKANYLAIIQKNLDTIQTMQITHIKLHIFFFQEFIFALILRVQKFFTKIKFITASKSALNLKFHIRIYN